MHKCREYIHTHLWYDCYYEHLHTCTIICLHEDGYSYNSNLFIVIKIYDMIVLAIIYDMIALTKI